MQPFTTDVVEGERWEGFWCLDDEKYYARCLAANGREFWYRIADDADVRVLPFKRRATGISAPRSVMMFGRVGRRSVLVGRYSRRNGAVR